jgi:hypothetical protein
MSLTVGVGVGAIKEGRRASHMEQTVTEIKSATLPESTIRCMVRIPTQYVSVFASDRWQHC